MNFRAAKRRRQDEAIRLANAPTGNRRGIAKAAHRVRVIETAMQLRRETKGTAK